MPMLMECTFDYVDYFSFSFPELIKEGHILQTPLFRVRNKKETIYCYSEDERRAHRKLKAKPEITRFKGWEISPNEFQFLLEDRLDPVMMDTSVEQLLSFYMGKTHQTAKIYYQNLKVDLDVIEEQFGNDDRIKAILPNQNK
jgi:topoisomerase-4 subunit B